MGIICLLFLCSLFKLSGIYYIFPSSANSRLLNSASYKFVHISKKETSLVLVDKRGFFHGAANRTRTGTESPLADFKSAMSTYSIIAAYSFHLGKQLTQSVPATGYPRRCVLEVCFYHPNPVTGLILTHFHSSVKQRISLQFVQV